MQVVNRKNIHETVSFDKITTRIQSLCNGLKHVDPILVAQDTIKALHDGITTREIDNLSADVSAGKSHQFPDYNKLGGRILSSNITKETEENYFKVVQALYNAGNLSENFYEFCKKNDKKIQEMFDYSRDLLFDYFAVKTLERSYLLKIDGKTVERPQHLWMRVAIQIHGLLDYEKDLEYVEKRYILERIKETYDLLSNLYFTHATPTLFNSGTKASQLSSCYLLGTDDNIEDMFKSIGDMAKMSKWSGGIGISLSNIRAKGSLIRGTNGKSDGIIPFCKTIEAMARQINQGGKRKGSIACYLEMFHPDIFDFIELRKNTGDENMRARDLYLALWVCDLFMKRVEEDGQWSLMCPDECKGLVDSYGEEFEELYLDYERRGKVRKTVRAKDLWNTVLECQIETGMPYISYKDNVNRKNMQSHLGVIKNSNLCVAPYTKILTRNGYQEIKNLAGQEVDVWNGEEWSKSVVQKTGENKKLFKVTFSNGESIDCTEYHKFPISDQTEMIETRNLKPGMPLSFCLPTENEKILLHVKSIENIEELSDTYCFNEPKKHLGILNGVLSGNCNEISLYSDKNNHAVCTLASICLPRFLENGKFNFEKLQHVSGIVTRNLNNVVDVNFYPTPEARKNNLENRPIGIGIQGLADVFCMLKIPFGSKEAKDLNKLIFENIYYGAVKMSIELAKKYSPYPNYKNSPHSKGFLQFSFYPNVKLTLPWEKLFDDMEKFGMRNSLLTAIMPTASTSQIMGNNECIEAFTTNLYVRKTLSGEFTVVNSHLVNDLISMGLWTKEIHEEIIHDNGSVQKIEKIPMKLREIYKTSFEIKIKDMLDQAVGRAPFIDHQQSMNLYLNPININALNSAHFYSWKNGLKTGIYYLHTMPAQDATKFGLDPNSVQRISKDRENPKNYQSNVSCPRDPILRALCDSCSA